MQSKRNAEGKPRLVRCSESSEAGDSRQCDVAHGGGDEEAAGRSQGFTRANSGKQIADKFEAKLASQ